MRLISFMGPDKRRVMTPARLEVLRRAKALQEPVRGEQNGAAKLTEAQVLKIRALRADGERPSVLALRFAVDRTLIWYITRRKIWTHV